MVSRSLITGHLFIGDDMLHKTDFFQEQTAQCRALGARATTKTDREFWLRLAQRWEELLQAKQRGTLKVEVPTVRFERPISKKRGRRAAA
jgi:hypothetical protein